MDYRGLTPSKRVSGFSTGSAAIATTIVRRGLNIEHGPLTDTGYSSWIRKQKINENGEKYKIITFNQEGTLEEKPDSNFVSFADNFFPGTMIYGKIYIKEKDILKNENRENWTSKIPI